MRASIMFIGSSKERSSRNSEKSKPSSSLTGTNTTSSGNSVSRLGMARADLDQRAGARRLAGAQEAVPLLGVVAQRADEQVLEERVPERLGGVPAEQDLGGLAPLRDHPLAVGQDEPATDDLLEQDVERIVGHEQRPGRRQRRAAAGIASSGGLGAGWRVGRREIHAGGASNGTVVLLIAQIGPDLDRRARVGGQRRAASQSSSSTAAARESSAAAPGRCCASAVVKRSS